MFETSILNSFLFSPGNKNKVFKFATFCKGIRLILGAFLYKIIVISYYEPLRNNVFYPSHNHSVSSKHMA